MYAAEDCNNEEFEREREVQNRILGRRIKIYAMEWDY